MRTDQHDAYGEMSATARFAREPKSVALARNWAVQAYSDAGGSEVDVCELLVSEVATNSVNYAEGPEFEVRVRSDLWIEVWDASRQEPQRRVANEQSTGGRGLELLELLAPGYTVDIGPDGKTVCFLPKGW
ncbi:MULTISPECIES: ATP-binding protein [unclassified Streptomyces]|uniref:ATP-binding protein n=1 Tax=unclassified Streptomyces TaxID=2593676 RepID=UPI003369E869